eukprot:TRINITY_DN10023_c0_g1_i1.p1 TRINITY_DN10023_c0_g1~~TRINITY_DN10023_c0_g1_i1.p1  ORF type:complete len:228 (+),score=73.65 TRINITY_DN10023_c0_g1_i1:100-684(+)
MGRMVLTPSEPIIPPMRDNLEMPNTPPSDEGKVNFEDLSRTLLGLNQQAPTETPPETNENKETSQKVPHTHPHEQDEDWGNSFAHYLSDITQHMDNNQTEIEPEHHEVANYYGDKTIDPVPQTDEQQQRRKKKFTTRRLIKENLRTVLYVGILTAVFLLYFILCRRNPAKPKKLKADDDVSAAIENTEIHSSQL